MFLLHQQPLNGSEFQLPPKLAETHFLAEEPQAFVFYKNIPFKSDEPDKTVAVVDLDTESVSPNASALHVVHRDGATMFGSILDWYLGKIAYGTYTLISTAPHILTVCALRRPEYYENEETHHLSVEIQIPTQDDHALFRFYKNVVRSSSNWQVNTAYLERILSGELKGLVDGIELDTGKSFDFRKSKNLGGLEKVLRQRFYDKYGIRLNKILTEDTLSKGDLFFKANAIIEQTPDHLGDATSPLTGTIAPDLQNRTAGLLRTLANLSVDPVSFALDIIVSWVEAAVNELSDPDDLRPQEAMIRGWGKWLTRLRFASTFGVMIQLFTLFILSSRITTNPLYLLLGLSLFAILIGSVAAEERYVRKNWLAKLRSPYLILPKDIHLRADRLLRRLVLLYLNRTSDALQSLRRPPKPPNVSGELKRLKLQVAEQIQLLGRGHIGRPTYLTTASITADQLSSLLKYDLKLRAMIKKIQEETRGLGQQENRYEPEDIRQLAQEFALFVDAFHMRSDHFEVLFGRA